MGIEKINVVLPGGLTRDADSDIEKDKQILRKVIEMGRKQLTPEVREKLESACVDICMQFEGRTLDDICDIFPE